MSDDPTFELLESIKPPEAFDRALAHLEMRTATNNLADGMDLSVSATFSEEYVEIPLSDGDVLEVKCSINEAIIVASHFNCSPTERIDLEPTRGYISAAETKQSIRETKSRGFDFEGGGAAKGSTGVFSGELAANAKTNSGKQMEHTSDTVSKATTQQVEYDVDQIRIYRNPDGTPLQGKLVDGQVCWRVTPQKKEKPFGVLAELRVKRGWMPISEPRQRNARGKIAALLTRVFSFSDDDEEFHREAFSLLVEHLVQKGLQSKQSGLEAVLAARAVVATPSQSEDRLEARYSTATEREVVLPTEDLKTVLSGDLTAVLNTLVRHQVDVKDLRSLVQTSKSEHVRILRPIISIEDRKETIEIVSIIVDKIKTNTEYLVISDKGPITEYRKDSSLSINIKNIVDKEGFSVEYGKKISNDIISYFNKSSIEIEPVEEVSEIAHVFMKSALFYSELLRSYGSENFKKFNTRFDSTDIGAIGDIRIIDHEIYTLYFYSLICEIGIKFIHVYDYGLVERNGLLYWTFIASDPNGPDLNHEYIGRSIRLKDINLGAILPEDRIRGIRNLDLGESGDVEWGSKGARFFKFSILLKFDFG